MRTKSSYTAKRGYILDAFYRWIHDNNLSAFVVANIHAPNIQAPLQYAVNGSITLDLSEDAVDNLKITPLYIRATCYFDEGPCDVYIPMHSVVGIYAAENMDGYSFEDDDEETESLLNAERALYPEKSVDLDKKSSHKKFPAHSHLQLVKPPSESHS